MRRRSPSINAERIVRIRGWTKKMAMASAIGRCWRAAKKNSVASASIGNNDSSGDNKLQGGGANKWSFESVTNWEFWFPGFPILVYYKENQTRPEGQPHFFPIIMDGKKLYEQMLEKMPTSVNPKPDPSEWNLDTAFEATPVGRKIKESLSEDQLKTLKETKGFPGLDK